LAQDVWYESLNGIIFDIFIAFYQNRDGIKKPRNPCWIPGIVIPILSAYGLLIYHMGKFCIDFFTSVVYNKNYLMGKLGVRELDILYKTNRLKKICTDYGTARQSYGQTMADKIHLRIQEITAADSVETLLQYSVGRCHPLKGNRDGEYAMDLVHPHRLVFEKREERLQLVKIVSIEDYH
jgi:proteic killer suppression protein